MSKQAISGVILTKNEEKNIVDCIESLDFCEEILVIDDFSEDRTLELLAKLKEPRIKVVKRRLEGDFSAQRNFALEKAENNWIFFLDADERVSPELKEEISRVVLHPQDHEAFAIRRVDNIWGKTLTHAEGGNDKHVRLGKKGKGRWVGKVHEKWQFKTTPLPLQHVIYHFPHPSAKDFLEEINFYTDLRASELFDKGVSVSWYSILTYPIGKFFVNFFIRRGFLDGTAGFIFALMMSFHSFLVRAKLWSRKKGYGKII